MNKKMREWFNLHGKELSGISIQIGEENPSINKLRSKLSAEDAARFLTLTGQLDGLIWAFHPEEPDEALIFIGEISELLEQLEEEARLLEKLGMKTFSTGEA